MNVSRARVIAAHRAPDRATVRMAPGDPVTLGDRDGDWPQFVWTTLASGLGGWIPSALFDIERGETRAEHAYDTQELDAEVGDLLILHRELADWWWAENERGACGWIPARALDMLDASTIDESRIDASGSMSSDHTGID